MLNRKIHYGNI